MRNLDTYADSYKAQDFEAIQAGYRRRHVLTFLRKAKAKRILEVGCGLRPLFLDYPDFDSFTVVEPAQAFFEVASQMSQAVSHVRLLQARFEDAIEHLRYEEFDVVLMSALLHEVSNPDALLGAARAIMGSGTVLHVNTLNARSFHRVLALEMGLIATLTELSATQIELQQHRVYTKESLRALLESEGFDVQEEGTYFLKPFAHWQMAVLMEQGLITSTMLDGFERMAKYAPDLGSELFVNATKKR